MTKKPAVIAATEKVIHSQIADYINLQYPNVIFLSDPSGMRVSIGLRQEIKRKRCRKYKVPDLIILQPNKGYCGLILEVKKDGEKLTKRDGSYVSEHIEQQAKSLAHLKAQGYAASFVTGFNDARNVIDEYLK